MPLPTDKNGNSIPAMRLVPGGGQTINATNTSAKNANAFKDGTQVLSVYATGPVWLKFGVDNTVTVSAADGHYFPDGVYYDFAIGGFTNDDNSKVDQYRYLAVLRASSDCVVYISEKE